MFSYLHNRRRLPAVLAMTLVTFLTTGVAADELFSSFGELLHGDPFQQSSATDGSPVAEESVIRRVSYMPQTGGPGSGNVTLIAVPITSAAQAASKVPGDRTVSIAAATELSAAPAVSVPPEVPVAAAATSPIAYGAPTADAAEAAPALTLEQIAARRAAVEQMAELPEDIRAVVIRHLQRAAELMTQKADLEKRITDLKAERDRGPAMIAEYRSLLAQPPPRAELDCPPGASVADLEKLRQHDEDQAGEAQRNVETWESKSRTRAERRLQIPALIETARKQLEETQKAQAGAAPESELPIVGAARRTELEAYVWLLRTQLELYRSEQSRFDALQEWFPLQRDVLTRTRTTLDRRMEHWKSVLAEARRDESARQAREARNKLQHAHPVLRDLAENNSALTMRRRELQEFLGQNAADLSAVNTSLRKVEQKFRDVVEKEDRAGLTTAVGLLLRSQRSQLPDAQPYRRRSEAAEQEIVRLQTEQMQLQDDRNALGDLQTQLETALNSIEAEIAVRDAASSGDALRQMMVELLSDRRQYLDDLLTDYDSCLQTLAEIDVSSRRLKSVIGEFAGYIDERVLWIRSAAAVDLGFIARTWNSIRNFVSHRHWTPLLDYVLTDIRSAWPVYGLFLFVFALVVGLNRYTRLFVAQLAEAARKRPDAGIPATLLATGLTVLTASAWPALMWFSAWRISDTGLSLAVALCEALKFCAVGFWVVNSFRALCRRQGVTESFLEWPQSIVRSLHTNLLMYLVCGLPLGFVVVAAEKLDEGTCADSVGRLAFICFCVLLAIVLRRLVRPSGVVIGDLLRSNPDSLMNRLRWLWYPLAVGSPLLLAALAVMGYQYTAEQLMIRLQLTLGLSLLLAIAYTMIMQWMLAARRSLAMKQARARRAAALAAAQRETEEEGIVAGTIPPVETPEIDLSLLNRQMLRLVRGAACILFLTVCWGIWGQVLPALQVLSRIPLWHVAVETTIQADVAEDGKISREVTRVRPVTLGHLFFSLAVISTALLASRNLPGLLELAVLQRLPMDHGGRYAITTLCRYALMLAGMITVCNAIGIGWGSVQWLVAALTVGLGFGLQEIFANFVSGLIILFERPVRIGDLITIDGVSGCVSKIQIRATTIMDWDRKEYIVPNKEFVTGKLLNWTLSDKINRIVINIGVAYGTDTERAMELLQQIADEHPLILKEPAPVMGFDGFGDSCLNLVLRCFLASFEQRMKVITQLHVTIDRRFREAGIEIAFPQRDLNIRSLPPQLLDAFLKPQPATAAAINESSENELPSPSQPTGEQDDQQSLKRSA